MTNYYEFKRKCIFAASKKKWVLVGLFLGTAMGIINPLASTHLEKNNVGNLYIGIISSSFFLFMSIGSILIDKKMRNRDMKGVILLGALAAAVACGIFPLATNLFLWLFLMIIMGFGISADMVGVQTTQATAI